MSHLISSHQRDPHCSLPTILPVGLALARNRVETGNLSFSSSSQPAYEPVVAVLVVAAIYCLFSAACFYSFICMPFVCSATLILKILIRTSWSHNGQVSVSD